MKAETARGSDPAEGSATTAGSPVTSAPLGHDGSQNGSTLSLEAEAVGNDRDAGVSFGASNSFPEIIPLPAAERPRRRSRSRLPVIPAFSLDDRFGRLMLSVVLAMLLWFYVINLENPEQTTVFKGLAVEVRGTGNNLKVINPVPAVDSIIQAPQDVMGSFRPADIKPYIDLTGLQEGVHEIPLHVEVSGARAGAAQVSLSPNTVQVQLEAQTSSEHLVVAQIAGTPAFGYTVEPAQVEPGRVKVSGSKEAVARIAQVVAQVDVDEKAGTQRGFRIPVALDSSGKEITGVTFEPQTVQVSVPIKLLFNYRVVSVHPNVVGQPAPGYRVLAITFNPTNVTVCCKPEVLDPLQSLDTTPITITGATSIVTSTTDLILPQDVELYPGQKKTVDVTVTFEKLVSTLQVSVVPTVEGVGDSLSVVISPDKFDLVLSGTFDQLQSLKPADIRAVVSMAGRGPGTYDLQPQVILPEGVKLQSATPLRVTVTLIAPTAVPPTVPPPTAVPPTQTAVPTLPLATATSSATARPVSSTVTGPAATVTAGLSPSPRATVTVPAATSTLAAQTSTPLAAPQLSPSPVNPAGLPTLPQTTPTP